MAVASALTEKAFADRREKEWTELATLAANAAKRRTRKKMTTLEIARLPVLYRSVCADLAAAEGARYSAPLVDYLRGVTSTAHASIYAKSRETISFRHAWVTAFPRAVRRHWKAMSISAALFFVPLIIGLVLTLRDPTFAFHVAPESMLRPLTEAYAKGFDDGRAMSDNSMMAGFYVNNNVGIALRCFALGIFGGLGSAFYLVFNGLSIGAILGYVASQGAGGNIATFIIGHGSLELGAIVLAGGAGLSIGWSIVAPGELTRIESLQKRAREVIVIVAGASVMLLMAACIEGFWSGSSAPRVVKIGLGATLFLLTLFYLSFGGRSKEAT